MMMPQQFSEFFGDMALIIAGVASFLKSIEWLLSVKHKQWLSAKTLELWNWIDDRKASIVVWQFELNKLQFTIVILAILLIACSVLGSIWGELSHSQYSFSQILSTVRLLLSIILVSWFLLIYFLPLQRRLATRVQENPIPYYAACIAVVAISSKSAVALAETSYVMLATTFGTLIYELVFLPVSFLLLTVSFVMLCNSVLAVLSVLFLLGFQLLFSTLEFVLRRVAESTSGPVIGASVVLGSVGAAIKLLS
jgi:hypothetical protein